MKKTIATQIHDHLINNDIVDHFQSAYKAGHSCDTTLLRVYNDIVTTIGRGNGAMLVLLDLFMMRALTVLTGGVLLSL